MSWRNRCCGVAAAALLLGLCQPVAAQDRRDPVVTSLTLFAGTPAGLWRSTDWGSNWQPITGPALEGLGAVHTIVALGLRVLVGGDGGLVVSEDFGQTWKRAPGELPPVHAILVSRYPDADPTIFLGTPQGLLRSRDAGKTFTPTALRAGRVSHLEWPGPALVAAGSKGVFISVDSADHFEGPGSGLPAGDVGALALSTFFALDPVLFAGVGNEGLFLSRDGGKTWRGAGLVGQRINDLVWLGPQLYAIGSGGVQRSEDAGATWKELREGLKGASPRRVLFPLAPDSAVEAFLATEQGAYHTTDAGLHWNAVGLKGEDVLCLATFPPAQDPRKKKR